MVNRVARRVVADDDAVGDLAQEALLQAYLSIHSLRDREHFRSWLYGITLHVCRSFRRSQHRTSISFEALVGGVYREPADTDPGPEEILERMELRRIVLDAVEALSPANRAALLLAYYEDFSLKEASTILGISVNALKGRLYKARRQIHEQLLPIIRSELGREGVAEMILVKVIDVGRREVNKDSGEPIPVYPIFLFDEVGRRALAIHLDEGSAMPIFVQLTDIQAPRPMAPLFAARLLEAAGATVDSVEITELKGAIFYAMVNVRVDAQVWAIDARPSDAIALALQVGAPIGVSEELLERVGVLIPAGSVPTGSGRESIQAYRRQHEEKLNRRQQRFDTKSEAKQQREEQEYTQMIVGEVFGKPG